MSQHDDTCAAARCHTPSPNARLCDGCVKLLREQLGALAGSPHARRVREDRPGPHRTVPREPGPWRDGTRRGGPFRHPSWSRRDESDPESDGGPEAATDLPEIPGQSGTVLAEPDRGLLADVEVTATRQDVTEPDTTRPAETVEGDERRTKDRPELAAGTFQLGFRPGAAALLREANGLLLTLTADVLDRRYGAWLDQQGRAVLRGERQYRRARIRCAVPLGEPHGPWQRPPMSPGRTAAEHAAWLQLHAHTVAQLEPGRRDGRPGHRADDVADLVDRAEAILVRPERVCLGHCGRCYDRDDGYSAIIDVWADKGADTAECPRCGQGFDVVEHRRRMLDSAAEQWVTGPDAVRALVDWVRDVRSRGEDGEPVEGETKPFTTDAIDGLVRRGRIAWRDPTAAECAAARAAEKRPPARVYRLGDVMAAVRTLHTEELARRKRTALRGGQRRRVPVEAGTGPARAAG